VQTRIGSGLARLCFAARMPIVLCEQEIELTFLRHVRPRIIHVLMAPIYDEHQQPLGAIWLAQVDSAQTYSRAETLILQRMAHDLALGLKTREREQEQAALSARLEAHCAHLEQELHDERLRREQAEALAAKSANEVKHEATLLREAHHRVKNTLQVSSSLLSLQAHSATLDSTRVALNKAAQRLRLVAHVNEQLYNPDPRLKRIATADLLNLVVASLRRNSAEGKQSITVHAASDDIEMSSGDCTTLMIIVNELVTNAFKHAFPEGLAGSITVELKREASELILRVADTGIGMHTPARGTHFGLSLVQNLVDQLGGTLTFANSLNPKGTLVTLTVPDTEERGISRVTHSPSHHTKTTTSELIS
jgi:two-component sensor histidine kinase